MWERTFQGVVVGTFIAFLAIAIFCLGGVAVLCIHAPNQTSSASFSPMTPSDPTASAINGLRTDIAAARREDARRYRAIDVRLKRLETRDVVAPSEPCGDGWSEETIPPHQ